MKDTELENAVKESVKRGLKGTTTGTDLLNIIRFQNRETKDLPIHDVIDLILLSVAYN
jgi:hypothetical protein